MSATNEGYQQQFQLSLKITEQTLNNLFNYYIILKYFCNRFLINNFILILCYLFFYNTYIKIIPKNIQKGTNNK